MSAVVCNIPYTVATMLRRAIVPCLTVVLAVGCSGIFDGIYDAPVPDTEFRPGFCASPGGGEGLFTLRIDARDYDKWIFIDLHRLVLEVRPVPVSLTGRWDGRSRWARYRVMGNRFEFLEDHPVDAQPVPEQWDLAIHHFDVRTNGGAVLRTPYTSISALPDSHEPLPDETFVSDTWTDHQCITDLSGMFDRLIWYQSSFVNPVLTEWVRMDFSTPPPKYEASPCVCLLRMADGTVAALRLRSYMSEAGTKGFLTIDVRYPY